MRVASSIHRHELRKRLACGGQCRGTETGGPLGFDNSVWDMWRSSHFICSLLLFCSLKSSGGSYVDGAGGAKGAGASFL